MLAPHVSAHVLKHRLGHVKIRTTYDLYSHAMAGQDRPAAELLAKLLRGPKGDK